VRGMRLHRGRDLTAVHMRHPQIGEYCRERTLIAQRRLSVDPTLL
jgi:hypothetical protein